jgi:hypothetical protein
MVVARDREADGVGCSDRAVEEARVVAGQCEAGAPVGEPPFPDGDPEIRQEPVADQRGE